LQKSKCSELSHFPTGEGKPAPTVFSHIISSTLINFSAEKIMLEVASEWHSFKDSLAPKRSGGAIFNNIPLDTLSRGRGMG
jgi:hypothetical protein